MIAIGVSTLKAYLEIRKLRSGGEDICIHLAALILFLNFYFVLAYH